MTGAVLPSVAFVVATLNEERRISACLDSLLAQDYPADRIEIAVVDGGSRDRTRELVEELGRREPRVRLHHNPRRIAAAAFNIGARETSADIVSLMSAHSVVDAGYARRLVQAFDDSGALLVGGRMVAVSDGTTAWGEAIRLATSSPFGLGNAGFHYRDEPGWTDTAFPGAYRRELLRELGGFDEGLVRNQDDELHLRARLRGHRMWFDPALACTYHPRTSPRSLWNQYYEYGYWRAATVLKHRRVASWRHCVPPLFVAALAGGATLLAVGPVRRVWFATLGGYSVFLSVGALRERVAARTSAEVAAAMAVVHLAYGSGFWVGLARRIGRG